MSQNTDLPTVRTAIANALHKIGCDNAACRGYASTFDYEGAVAILATLSDPDVVEELLAHWFGENPHNKDGVWRAYHAGFRFAFRCRERADEIAAELRQRTRNEGQG